MPLSAVSLITSTPRRFACVRTRIPVADVPQRFREFLDEVYAAGKAGTAKLDGQNIFVYRPTESESIVDVDFGVGVKEPFTAGGNIVMSHLPTGRAATTTLTGDYGGIRGGHHAIIDWCKAHHHERSGVRWEIYGHWTEDASKLETQIFHQVTSPV